eukprot:3866474-Pleurochrysis_carterae.AAC.2
MPAATDGTILPPLAASEAPPGQLCVALALVRIGQTCRSRLLCKVDSLKAPGLHCLHLELVAQLLQPARTDRKVRSRLACDVLQRDRTKPRPVVLAQRQHVFLQELEKPRSRLVQVQRSLLPHAVLYLVHDFRKRCFRRDHRQPAFGC